MTKKTVLLLTDFAYKAKGREYFREDVELSNYLRKHFHVCIAHMGDIDRIVDHVDIILLRNTGPQMLHRKELAALRKRKDLLFSNDLLGKGDLEGKRHLRELFLARFPVIPTYTSKDELREKGVRYNRYSLKPLDAADSIGVKILSHDEMLLEDTKGSLIQPLLDFQYEVSFYFVDDQFQYALYAHNPDKRWQLELYNALKEDIEFALKFIKWNSCKRGIQRVDACRLPDGQLLLMELEDYNPFLSLDLLPKDLKISFLEALCVSLKEAMR